MLRPIAIDNVRPMPDLAALDAIDPLRHVVAEFIDDEPGLVYLDGNSLGRLHPDVAAAVERTTRDEWGRGLVRSWSSWVEAPRRGGDLIGSLIGAGPGEVLIADQTSVNLYKLASAAMDRRGERSVIVTDAANFPSDHYILAAVADRHGAALRVVGSTAELAESIDEDTALVSLSHVAFKGGELLDMAAINELTRSAGAMTLWDLSHSVGAVDIDLGGTGTDLAVGCTYKYLNGGPGSPAFLYVRTDLQGELHNPIPAWFGHADMFSFSLDYRPAPGIDRFATGTPPMIQVAAVEAAARVVAKVGMPAIRAKSVALTEAMISLADERLAPLGFEVVTPRDPARRGSHVALRHDDAFRISQAMIARDVVPDFRAPDVIRLGLSPLTTRFTDLETATRRIEDLMAAGEHMEIPHERGRIT